VIRKSNDIYNVYVMSMDAVSGLFSFIPVDWIVIISFAILIGFDAMRSGMGRACALALSLPATMLLITALPKAGILSNFTEQFTSSSFRAAVFGIVLIASYFLVRKITASHRNNRREITQSLVAGASTVAVMVVVWLQIPELQAIWQFGPQVQMVFGEAYRFWLVIGAYTALAFVRS
jgi:hypothetical protein